MNSLMDFLECALALGDDATAADTARATALAARMLQQPPPQVTCRDEEELCRALEVWVLLKSTELGWTRPTADAAAATVEAEWKNLRAHVDQVMLGPDHARWRVPSKMMELKCATCDLAWYTFNMLDLAWVAVARIKCLGHRDNAWMRAWHDVPALYKPAPNDLRAFFGKYVGAIPAFKIPFTALGCGALMEVLEFAAGALLNAPPEVRRTPEWTREANFAFRGLEMRARILCAFEHDARVIGERYALNGVRVVSDDAAQQDGAGAGGAAKAKAKKYTPIAEILRDARDRDAEAREMELRLAAQRGEEDAAEAEAKGGARDAEAAQRGAQKLREKYAMQDAALEMERTWVARMMGKGDAGAAGADDGNQGPKRIRSSGGTGGAPERVVPPKTVVGITFACEVRLFTSHALRELAESAALDGVVFPELDDGDRGALARIMVWLAQRMRQVNRNNARDAFRAFVASRTCTPADFAVDKVRNPLTPSKTGVEVITRRGDAVGEMAIIPTALGTREEAALEFPRDYADFCLHRFSACGGSGPSAVEALLGGKPLGIGLPSFYESAAPKHRVFWDAGRGAYVFRCDAGNLLAFQSITECVVYTTRRKILPLKFQAGRRECDLRGMESMLFA